MNSGEIQTFNPLQSQSERVKKSVLSFCLRYASPSLPPILIDNFLYSTLNDGLCTLIAWEKGNIDFAAVEVPSGTVQDGIELCMTDKRIFCVQRLTVPAPGKGVVTAADGQAIVANRHDLIVLVDDAGSDLSMGVFAAHGRQDGNSHEILVPGDIVFTFRHGGLRFSDGEIGLLDQLFHLVHNSLIDGAALPTEVHISLFLAEHGKGLPNAAGDVVTALADAEIVERISGTLIDVPINFGLKVLQLIVQGGNGNGGKCGGGKIDVDCCFCTSYFTR